MKRFAFWFITITLVIVTVGPFLVPVPPLEDTVDPKELADPDSRFISVDGLRVHYKESGQGEPVFVLLHGFGASAFTWREVMADFAATGRTVAYDRTAFGLTERPVEWTGENPYGTTAQVKQAVGLMDALGIRQAILVGNSAGGRTAVDVALAHPERVQALILVSPAVGLGGGGGGWLRPLFATPQMNHLGPLLARQISRGGDDMIKRAWHDPALMGPEVIAGYRKPLRADHWDRALWELTRAPRATSVDGRGIEQRLADLAAIKTLIVTGDDDRIVPVSASKAVADAIPGSVYIELPQCGHVPQEECPAAFMSSVQGFLAEHVR